MRIASAGWLHPPAIIGCALFSVTAFPLRSVSARELLYIEAEQSKDVHIVDAHTLQEVGRVEVGQPTDDIVGSPDGKFAFGNAMVPSGNPIGYPEAGFVYCIDTATNKVLWTVAIPGMPQHLTVSKDGRRLFVPAFDKNYIYVVDTAAGRIVDTWFGVLGNHGSELSSDGKHLYLGNMVMNRIYVYDTGTGQVVQTYLTRNAVRPFKIDREGKRIYYQLSNFHGFEVRNLESGRVEQVVDLPKMPPEAQAGDYGTVDHGLAITPDDRKILAAGSVAGYVAIYKLPDLQLLGTVPVGEDANWIRVRADSKIAFVSNRGSNDLSVIDLDALKEIKRIPVGKRPARFDIIDVP
jgi:YVTN family beta-propeller protein